MHCAQPHAAPLKAPHVTRSLHSTVYAFPVEYGSTEIRITVIYNWRVGFCNRSRNEFRRGVKSTKF